MNINTIVEKLKTNNAYIEMYSYTYTYIHAYIYMHIVAHNFFVGGVGGDTE